VISCAGGPAAPEIAVACLPRLDAGEQPSSLSPARKLIQTPNLAGRDVLGAAKFRRQLGEKPGAQVGLYQPAVLSGLREQMNVNLIRAKLSRLLAQMRQIKRARLFDGSSDPERRPFSEHIAMDQNIIDLWHCRAGGKRINAMQITPPRSTTPIMKDLSDITFGTKDSRIVRRSELQDKRLVYSTHCH